ncbi:hypothetical protein [Paraflavitalea sp. CAU 1676]|uniref:hypothetical protein n=1 Tax=Paraflavitalea sp. CAU 1676 TaxID=3032598 RepID=UPI0023DC4BAD|nr:hypothetical protein [Paraflavitalea sp. CAU 1676]MDF2192812.1 hypothetical protein [Paraflavitalea sp. CAU 1676]
MTFAHFSMIKPKRPLVVILLLLTQFFANGQDFVGFSEIGEKMSVISPNPEERINKIRTVTKTISDSVGTRVLSRLTYSPGGYLSKFTEYYNYPSTDSIVYSFHRSKANEAVMTANTFRATIAKTIEGNSLHAFIDDIEHLESEAVEIKKIYSNTPDSNFKITTMINGKVVDSIEIPQLIKLEAEIKNQKPDTTKYDSTYLGDTLLLKTVGVVNNLSNLIKKWQISSIKEPVKVESFTYRGDSLIYYDLYINEYDNKKRLISHSEFGGPPLKQFISEKTEYNDKTGERIEYHDSNPTSGRPKRIWTYNRKGKLISAIRYFDGYESEGRLILEYDKKGLLVKETNFINNKLESTVTYGYTYYRQR